jgi:hypothetical protein
VEPNDLQLGLEPLLLLHLPLQLLLLMVVDQFFDMYLLPLQLVDRLLHMDLELLLMSVLVMLL